jgi:hypothetical protein
MIADDATGAGETTTDGSAGGEGVVSGGGGAPGNGRGRGLPLEAQAAADRAIRTRSALGARRRARSADDSNARIVTV